MFHYVPGGGAEFLKIYVNKIYVNKMRLGLGFTANRLSRASRKQPTFQSCLEDLRKVSQQNVALIPDPNKKLHKFMLIQRTPKQPTFQSMPEDLRTGRREWPRRATCIVA